MTRLSFLLHLQPQLTQLTPLFPNDPVANLNAAFIEITDRDILDQISGGHGPGGHGDSGHSHVDSGSNSHHGFENKMDFGFSYHQETHNKDGSWSEKDFQAHGGDVLQR